MVLQGAPPVTPLKAFSPEDVNRASPGLLPCGRGRYGPELGRWASEVVTGGAEGSGCQSLSEAVRLGPRALSTHQRDIAARGAAGAKGWCCSASGTCPSEGWGRLLRGGTGPYHHPRSGRLCTSVRHRGGHCTTTMAAYLMDLARKEVVRSPESSAASADVILELLSAKAS